MLPIEIIVAKKIFFSNIRIQKILPSARETLVLRRKILNHLNLILLVVISYRVLISYIVTFLFLFILFKNLISNYVIIDPTQLAPQPYFTFSNSVFHRQSDIPFKSTFCFTFIHSLHPSEILKLYGLAALIPLYLIIIPSTQIKSFVLHVLFFRVIQYDNPIFIYHIVPPVIPNSN